MRRPRYLDFVCPACETRHTRFVETNDDDTPLEPEVCNTTGAFVIDGDGEIETCDGVLTQVDTTFDGYMKCITKGNHDFSERERARLEKRADDHWRKQGKDEAIARERAILRKNGMDGAGGVK